MSLPACAKMPVSGPMKPMRMVSAAAAGLVASTARARTSAVVRPMRGNLMVAAPVRRDWGAADSLTLPSPPVGERVSMGRGRSAAEGLQRHLEAALAVGPGAGEPGVPGGLGGLARLGQLLLGRIHDRHAELGQPLAHPLVERDRVAPLLLLEVGLLDRVEHDLLEIGGER